MLIERLKQLRNSAKLTQSEVAQALNITREAYTMYETGKRQISHETLCNIADFYQVSLDYLFCRTDIDDPIEHFTKEEYTLLQNYRSLDQRGKENIQYMADYEYHRLCKSLRGKA